MCSRKVVVGVAVFLLIVTAGVRADWHNWYGSGGVDQNWDNPLNWQYQTAPDPWDNPIVDTDLSGASKYPILSSGNHNYFEVYVGWNNDGAMRMTGGTIATDAGSWKGLALGYNTAGKSGTLYMDGGTITVNSRMYLGNESGTWGGTTGIIEMAGGTIYNNFMWEAMTLSGSSHIDLTGGTIDGERLLIKSSGAYVNITDTGKLILRHQNTGLLLTDIAGYIASNQIRGDNLQVAWDGNIVTITSIPEPATMLLLGLGGLLFRRKK